MSNNTTDLLDPVEQQDRDDTIEYALDMLVREALSGFGDAAAERGRLSPEVLDLVERRLRTNMADGDDLAAVRYLMLADYARDESVRQHFDSCLARKTVVNYNAIEAFEWVATRDYREVWDDEEEMRRAMLAVATYVIESSLE